MRAHYFADDIKEHADPQDGRHDHAQALAMVYALGELRQHCWPAKRGAAAGAAVLAAVAQATRPSIHNGSVGDRRPDWDGHGGRHLVRSLPTPAAVVPRAGTSASLEPDDDATRGHAPTHTTRVPPTHAHGGTGHGRRHTDRLLPVAVPPVEAAQGARGGGRYVGERRAAAPQREKVTSKGPSHGWHGP